MELRAADFGTFFQAVHGCSPFPWQQRLVDRLAEDDEWPDVLDLPTGAGKTAAMDAAVFHLALRADAPGKAALRIAFVVDRRLVVDDAFERANKIADTLCLALRDDAKVDDVVGEVARRLRRLAGDSAPPLVARRLRGGAPLEHDWVRTPTQPTILCSTVDQVGSRLLFRGYGVSDRMKPVHAGLLGVDSLILLDEAHLSKPFRQTLDAVRRIGKASVRMAILSATPGAGAKRRFELSSADRSDPVLKERLKAHKPVTLEKPLCGESAAISAAFAQAACAMAKRLQQRDVSPTAVGVVVNRVALARGIFNVLTAEDGVEPMLMIGPSRDVGRDRIVKELAPFRTGEDRSQAKPLFIVATQCMEVGVDLDLDGLVTQAAFLDALRQRFGRLNRAGRQVPAEGRILACAEDVGKKADDPVYGDRIRRTWEALQEVAEDGRVDFGVEALPKCLEKAGIDHAKLAAKQANAPVVMPAYLDLWAQTSPRPTADPEVGLFLHGVERTTAGVSVVWRGDVSEQDMQDARSAEIEELLRLVPPRAAEAVEVSLWAAQAWLRRVRGDEGALDPMADVPAREVGRPVSAHATGRPAFRWAGAGDSRTSVVSPDELHPGDMVIVPAEYGGCDQFGWAPDSDSAVEDVANEAASPFWGRRCAVRIAPGLLLDDLWNRISGVLQDDAARPAELVDRLLDALPAGEALKEALKKEEEEHSPSTVRAVQGARKGLKKLRRLKRGRLELRFPYRGGREVGAVFVAEQGVEGAGRSDDARSATEDDSISPTFGKPVALDDHGVRVEHLAGRFAETLGLGEAADLRLAAYLHDAGKADPRFQTMLSGGDSWNRPEGPPLAKSGARNWSPAAGKRAGLPEGWRHEALSVRMAQAHPRFANAHDPALVLWLIGSHHGLGRPFFSFLDPVPDQCLPECLGVENWRLRAGEPGPQSLAFEFRGADWPSLFEDLQQRYGIWKLAHLEAVLRLADHRASEEERNP